MDLPPEFMGALRLFCDDFPHRIDDYEKLLRENEILISRTKGVAVLSAETAKNNSLSGPVLRASGVNWDLRKSDPYEIYDRLDFEVPLGQTGDTYDRFLVRLEELRQSLKIILQCVKDMPIGETRLKLPALIRPPKGDAYGHVEAPKGELGFYVVSDGTIAPYRLKIRAPSFINLTALREMTIGYKLADLIVVFGSIDVNMGEVDR